MIDQLQYSIGVPAEELSRYCPGGYHPMHIDDVLKDGRYHILHKLGFGAFSTVWLARDNTYAHDPSGSMPGASDVYYRNLSNVSIKVVVSNCSGSQSPELGILQHIEEKGDPNHPGSKHIPRLIDSFHHEGPNGRHLCVVTELLGPKVSSVMEKCTNYRLDGHLVRRVSRQLLLVVDYLHSCGVAHGGMFLLCR